MKTLQVTEANAYQAYNQADTAGKALLSNLFGAEVFSRSITDRVKTFEDACALVGVDPFSITDLSMPADEVNYRKWKVIVQALNEGWYPDWNDRSQRKYYPFMQWNGTGFSLHGVVGYYTLSHVGSRLCFRSAELARYAVTQFPEIYNGFLK